MDRIGPIAEGAFVEGTDHLLTAPDRPTTKTMTNAQVCSMLGDPGWEADCDRVKTAIGEGAWLVERQQEGNVARERVLLYVRQGETWDLALRASDDTGREFDAHVETADLAGDGNHKIVFLLREVDEDLTDGVAPALFVDVVEPNGATVLHVVARGGRSGIPQARALAGRGIEVWDCPVDCVPTAPLRYRRIAYHEGRWQVVEEGSGHPPA